MTVPIRDGRTAAKRPPPVIPGGLAGAWLADLLLYLFGVSAWWVGVIFCYFWCRGFITASTAEYSTAAPFFSPLPVLLSC